MSPGKCIQIGLVTDITKGRDGLPGLIEVVYQVTIVNWKNGNSLNIMINIVWEAKYYTTSICYHYVLQHNSQRFM